jgi:hypothetical protein
LRDSPSIYVPLLTGDGTGTGTGTGTGAGTGFAAAGGQPPPPISPVLAARAATALVEAKR